MCHHRGISKIGVHQRCRAHYEVKRADDETALCPCSSGPLRISPSVQLGLGGCCLWKRQHRDHLALAVDGHQNCRNLVRSISLGDATVKVDAWDGSPILITGLHWALRVLLAFAGHAVMGDVKVHETLSPQHLVFLEQTVPPSLFAIALLDEVD